MTPRVLIVDDDPVFRELARAMLRLAGFNEIDEAADIAAALEAVSRRPPDAVLLDVHLPDGDGVALARELAPVTSVLLTSTDDDIAPGPGVAFVPKAELPAADLRGHLGIAPGRPL